MTEIIFDENEDWEKRILCSDESCIGTIGPDGKCKECGKVYEGELPAVYEESKHENAQPVQETVAVHGEADDWDKRVLCSDESCIGVIGADGKCRECGKPF
jgi:hypothetical protein